MPWTTEEKTFAVEACFWFKSIQTTHLQFKDLQWFQQEGATPHTSNESLAWPQQHFSDYLFS
jgi:hypothetical protein